MGRKEEEAPKVLTMYQSEKGSQWTKPQSNQTWYIPAGSPWSFQPTPMGSSPVPLPGIPAEADGWPPKPKT